MTPGCQSLASGPLAADYSRSVDFSAATGALEIIALPAVHDAGLSSGIAAKRQSRTAPHGRREHAGAQSRLETVDTPTLSERV